MSISSLRLKHFCQVHKGFVKNVITSEHLGEENYKNFDNFTNLPYQRNKIWKEPGRFLCQLSAHSHRVDIHSVPRTKDNHQVLSYPRFPMRHFEDLVLDVNNLSAAEHSLYDSLCVDEDTIDSIEQETRKSQKNGRRNEHIDSRHHSSIQFPIDKETMRNFPKI